MDYVTRQFINLTKKLRKDLRYALTSLNKNIQKITEAVEHQTEQTRNYQDSQKNQSGPFYGDAITHKPEEDDRQEARRYRFAQGIQVAIALFTLGTLLAASYYASLAKKQWDAMRCANALTESNYINDQRAWIGFALPDVPQKRADPVTKRPIDIVVPVSTVNTREDSSLRRTWEFGRNHHQ